MPGSENVKNHYKDYVVTDVKRQQRIYALHLQPKVGNVFAPDEEVKVHVNTEGKVVLINGDTDAKKVKPTNEVSINKEQASKKRLKRLTLILRKRKYER